MATMKSKQELKDVFMGLSSIMIVKNGITNFATVNPDFDLPVMIDSLSLTMGEPTINRVKVHGLQADWAVTSTPGDITFSATVPSTHKDLITLFLGTTTPIATATVNGTKFEGVSAKLESVKVNLGFVLLSEDKQKCVVVKKMAIYARPLFENASTEPFGFALSGSIEIADGDSGDNIAFLTKSAVQA